MTMTQDFITQHKDKQEFINIILAILYCDQKYDHITIDVGTCFAVCNAIEPINYKTKLLINEIIYLYKPRTQNIYEFPSLRKFVYTQQDMRNKFFSARERLTLKSWLKNILMEIPIPQKSWKHLL